MTTQLLRSRRLFVAFVLVLLTRVSLAQIVFQEDFSDRNAQDGHPVHWVERELTGATYDVSTGDYIFRAGLAYDLSGPSLAADPVDYVLTDSSVVAQIRGNGPFSDLGIGARWNEAATTGYFAGFGRNSVLYVGRCDGPVACPVLNNVSVGDLDLIAEDVLLRFDAVGDQLSAWAWRPGQPMPETPTLTVSDPTYTVGTPAIYANPLHNGEGIYRFINVSVPYTPEKTLQGRFGNVRRVEGTINQPGPGTLDVSPALTTDQLEMIFRSNRFDESDLFRVTRSLPQDPFENEELLEALNSPANDNGANLSSDGLTLYFSSDRDASLGRNDLFLATRPSRTEPFGNVVHLPAGLNTEYEDMSPNVSADGLSLYFASDRPDGEGDLDLYVAARASLEDPFGEPENLGPEINSASNDGTPTISSDGLHLVFHSPRVGNAELYIASRESTDEPFGPAIRLDEFGIGSYIHSSVPAEADPQLSADWPAIGSKIYFSGYTGSEEADLWEATWSVNGDLDFDGQLTVADLDQVMQRTARCEAGCTLVGATRLITFDIDLDGVIDREDGRVWVEELKGTYFGDANLDGEFNSDDLTLVFQAGEYEDELLRNSTWATGDWNGDRDFDSGDLVRAFQAGGYEQGRRGPAPVPEPVAATLAMVTLCVILPRARGVRPANGARRPSDVQ